ncbi:MAG: putative sugar O-methyltransferase [Alphaproteobacteria bacterium]|nr:putative sugar O-methyltransferase [Alphaproteobacteria bacterium]
MCEPVWESLDSHFLQAALETRAGPWDVEKDLNLNDPTSDILLEKYKNGRFGSFSYKLNKPDGDFVLDAQDKVNKYKNIKGSLKNEVTKVFGNSIAGNSSGELLFLSDIGMLGDYIEFIKKLDICPSNTLYRYYYYSTLITRILALLNKEKVRILEIGSGVGFMPFVFETLGIIESYTSIDLSGMMGYCAFNISNTFPDVELNFDPEKLNDETCKWNFIKPDLFPKIGENKFDLVINFNSFMEMDQKTVRLYFDNIYRTASQGCTFFNSNRVNSALRQSDGSAFFSNPLSYPYRDSDHVIAWDIDPISFAGRQMVRGEIPRHNGFLRAGIINPTDKHRALGTYTLVPHAEAMVARPGAG